MKETLRVGVIGASEMGGQRFISLMHDHPWYEITCLAETNGKRGKQYADTVDQDWRSKIDLSDELSSMVLKCAHSVDEITDMVDLVYCAGQTDDKIIDSFSKEYSKRDVTIIFE